MKSYDRLFIGGEWVEPSSSSVFEVISPTTGELVGRTPEAQDADIDRAVAAAREAFDHGPWPRMAPAERGAVLAKVAEAIRNDMQGIAELISYEMGSPISWGLMAQVLAPTMILDYYAGLGSTFAFDTVKDGLLGPVLVTKEPIGVVAAITPWNVPLFLAAAKLAPALLSGSTVVFKPAPETPLDANVLAEIFADAGLPKGVLSVVPAGREVGEHLVNHPGVDKVSFTGSTAAGKKIGAACGATLKRFSLELGGKSAAILLDDVNLDEALPLMMPNAIMNNGEACISLTRILAPRDRYTEVAEALVEQVRAMKVGDALDPATDVGPLVAERQRDRVENYIRIGQEEGAKVAVGGGRPKGLPTGWFVEPTVLVDVDNDAYRPGGDLRPGAVGHPLRRRGRRRAHRQRLRLRLVRRGVQRRQRSWPRRRPTGAHRDLHGELGHPDRLLLALRWLQGVGHGARVRRGRPRAVPREEDHQPPCRVQPDGVTRASRSGSNGEVQRRSGPTPNAPSGRRGAANMVGELWRPLHGRDRTRGSGGPVHDR